MMASSDPTSRRKKKQEEKEYHDFLYSVESSAKKILKASNKKQIQEANRARIKALQEATRIKHRKKRRNPSGIIIEDLDKDDFQPSNNNGKEIKMPPLSTNKSANLAFMKGPAKGNSSSLPRLPTSIILEEPNKSSPAEMIARVKEKLSKSPLAWSSSHGGYNIITDVPEADVGKAKPQNIFQKNDLERIPTLVEVTSGGIEETSSGARNLKQKKNKLTFKIKGHFAPGTVPNRPEHATQRRLALSAWLNPHSQTQVEKGLSTSAMKALKTDNELQGPTNWSSVDLRSKYRDEVIRHAAHTASLEREREAERLRIEEHIFISVVTIAKHPIHVDFEVVVDEENSAAQRRARNRNRLKVFSLDLPVIWNANRPSMEELEEIKPSLIVNGVQNRRDVLAHEQNDCQVQSVTEVRALQGAIQHDDIDHNSESKSNEDTQAIFNKLAQIKQGNLVSKNRKPFADIQNKEGSAEQTLILRVENRGLVLTLHDDLEDIEREIIKTSPNNAIQWLIVSVYSGDADNVTDKTECKIIRAYSPDTSKEIRFDISLERLKDSFEKRKLLEEEQRRQSKQLQATLKQKWEQETSQRVDRALFFVKAIWWYGISIALTLQRVDVPLGTHIESFKLSGILTDQEKNCTELFNSFHEAENQKLFRKKKSKIIYKRVVRLSTTDSSSNNTVLHLSKRCFLSISIVYLETEAKLCPDAIGNTQVVVFVHIRDIVSSKTIDAAGYLGSAVLDWMVRSTLVGEHDVPKGSPSQTYSWWLEESDWRSQIMGSFIQALRLNEKLQLCLEGLGSIQKKHMMSKLAEAGDQVKFKADKENGAAHADVVKNSEMDSWNSTKSERFLWYSALRAEEQFGGVGLIEKLIKHDRRRRLFNGVDTNEAEAKLDKEIQSDCMALVICGRYGDKSHFIGHEVPSASLKGSLGLVPALFFHQTGASESKSVNCTVSTALDSPLFCPKILAFCNLSLTPKKSPDELIKGIQASFLVSPFIVRAVVSKLDFRESNTIVTLNASCDDLDIGINNKMGTQKEIPGHRRLEPEITALFFRVRLTPPVDQLCFPIKTCPAYVFGVTQASATLNAPDTWPHRYTWHSDDIIAHELTRRRIAIDYAYVSKRGATVGCNDPNAYPIFLVVNDFQKIVRRPRTEALKQALDFEESEVNMDYSEILESRKLAAEKGRHRSEEERQLLKQELNDKRIQRERRLKGKTAQEQGIGARKSDWIKRKDDPTTKKLGRWRKWQAYLYLDHEAKEIILKSRLKQEGLQLARIAKGERPKPETEIEKEIELLSIKEGTLFYNNEEDDSFQWDQPYGWQGIATIPADIDDTGISVSSNIDDDMDEETIKLRDDYNARKLRKKQQDELRQMRIRDAAAALKAAKSVEHSRRVREVGKNIRNWMDRKAGGKTSENHAFDLRESFLEIDEERKGVLNYEEFKLGLAHNLIELTLEDQDTLIKHLDPEGDESVDYMEFITWALGMQPDSSPIWSSLSLDLTQHSPAKWAEIVKESKHIGNIVLWDIYKDVEDTGQHFYHSLESGEYTWIKPEKVVIAQRLEQDAKELREAQIATSLAAKAAAESAEQAERASDRSVENLVKQLASSDNFVSLLASRLGLDTANMAENLLSNNDTKVPRLNLSKEADNDTDDDEDYDSEDGLVYQPQNDAEVTLEKKGHEWRLLRPKNLDRGFITQASNPHTMKPDPSLTTGNNPSLVGVVDPAEASHVPFDDFPEVEAKFIADVMEDTEIYAEKEGKSVNKDALLDTSGEQEMLEMIHKAFQAVRNAKIDVVEECIDLGVRITERDENGNTLLLLAAQQNLKRISKFLLRRGSDINVQNLLGNTVLHYCFMYSFEDLAEYFISKGADDSLLNKDGLTCYEGLSTKDVDAI